MTTKRTKAMKAMTPMTLVVLSTIAASGACADLADENDLPEEVVWRDELYDRVDRMDEAGVARLPDSAQHGSDRALAARPQDQLAESLRMTILHPNGGAYVARTPNWAAAEATLHPTGPVERISRAVADRLGATAPLAPARDEGSSVRPGAPAGTAELVIGSDGRVLSPTGLSPYNAIARVDVYTSATGGSYRISCTGSYIGPWTFVLAGHCLRFTDGTFAKRIVFEPERAASSVPYRFDCRNGDSSTTNDFVAAVPTGYFGARSEDPLDFAVIDVYPCHSAPHSFPGYAVNTGSTTYTMHGYPIGRCPGAPVDGTVMCGMSGPAYINDWRIETEHIDATDGQDGAPWWTTNPTRVAGVHIGYREYHDFGRCGFDICRRNYARQIDSTMDAFIRTIAYDF